MRGTEVWTLSANANGSVEVPKHATAGCCSVGQGRCNVKSSSEPTRAWTGTQVRCPLSWMSLFCFSRHISASQVDKGLQSLYFRHSWFSKGLQGLPKCQNRHLVAGLFTYLLRSWAGTSLVFLLTGCITSLWNEHRCPSAGLGTWVQAVQLGVVSVLVIQDLRKGKWWLLKISSFVYTRWK